MDKHAVTQISVGVDISLAATGFARVMGNRSELMTIKTKPRDFPTPFERYEHIVNTILSGIPDCTTLIAIEDYYVPQSKAQFGAAINLVALGTLVRKALYDKGLPFIIIAPSQIKKFVTGKGNAQKSLILREVFKRWQIDAADDNQADAFSLAKMAEASERISRGDNAFPQYQLDTIRKVLKERPKYHYEPSL